MSLFYMFITLTSQLRINWASRFWSAVGMSSYVSAEEAPSRAETADQRLLEIYNTQTNRPHVTLSLNKTAVRHLIFSPSSESILVSIGEQIAWWNITKIPESLINRRSYRKHRKDDAMNDLSNQMATVNFLQNWTNKLGTASKPHLLRTFKLQGSHADWIVASPNFKSFVTIDDSGKLYIMELLE